MIWNYKNIFKEAVNNSSYWYVNKITPYLCPIVNIAKKLESKKPNSLPMHAQTPHFSRPDVTSFTPSSYFQPSLT